MSLAWVFDRSKNNVIKGEKNTQQAPSFTNKKPINQEIKQPPTEPKEPIEPTEATEEEVQERLEPCYCCGNTRYWEGKSGVIRCQVCHPPANPGAVLCYLDESDNVK